MPPTKQRDSDINTIRGVTGQISVSAPDERGNIALGNSGFSGLNTDSLAEGVTHFYFTNERVDDRVNALIQNGTGITWVYSDVGGTLTPTVTITQYTDEMVDDRVAVFLQSVGGITWTYNDGSNTLSPAVDHGSVGGLGDDDHSQYYNSARIETWYGTKIKQRGSVALSAGTATVMTANVATGDLVILTPRGVAAGGALGVTIADGVSFTIDSLNVLDGRTVDYAILD